MRSSPSNRSQIVISGVLLGLLILFAVTQDSPEETRAFDLTSPAPNGLLALRLWFTEMGYTVEESAGDEYLLPASTTLFFIPPTNYRYTKQEASVLAEWIADGGTAIIIGPHPGDKHLIEPFGVQPGESTPLFFTARQQQPLLPPVEEIELTGAYASLDLSNAPAAIPLLASGDGQITAAMQRYGEGTIWHFSAHHSFANEQLRDPEQAMLALAALRMIDSGSTDGGSTDGGSTNSGSINGGSTIRFDTFHLWGAAGNELFSVRTLQEWLYYTGWGQALLFVIVVTALVLLLQGRRLGPPLPVQTETRKREAAEYVVAMANLARRARHRHMTADHHKRRLKRALGHRTQVDATLDDADFIQQLAANDVAQTTDGHSSATETEDILQSLTTATTDRALIEAIDRVDRAVGLKTIIKEH